MLNDCSMDATQATHTPLHLGSELGDAKQSSSKGVIEGPSLQNMLNSLKLELDTLKKQHAELLLKDKDAGKSKNEGTSQSQGQQVEGPQNPKLRENESSTTYSEEQQLEKRQRVVVGGCNVDKTKQGSVMSNVDGSKSLTPKIYGACVSMSTSESGARIENEVEASSKKNKLKRGKGKSTLVNGRPQSTTYHHSSEFSIRDYVFAARNKDISTNWPFSQKNLQLCLKHGVKDVLPPFKQMESMRDRSIKRCLANPSLQCEENNFDENPLALENHLGPGISIDRQWKQDTAEGYRDSNSLPSVGEEEKELVFRTMTMTNTQSEVESNVPLSEVSDEQGAAASAANDKTKCLTSQYSSKKCNVGVKMSSSGVRGAADDTTSVCTAPPEATVSKICPVCESFSSSSNTTLNAHIDQCLSSQSAPNWMKNSKLVKPRIKPRKMRLMSDICTTAPQCTLEDLDRRNGTNWATNAEFSSQDTELINQGKNSRVLSKFVETSGDDGAVYIDSSGRKIGILSKFNDISSSSFPKTGEDPKQVKRSKPGERSRFFSSKRINHLAKHLKYLKASRQRKRFSSIKVKGSANEVCATAASMSKLREKHVKEHLSASRIKAQEHKNSNLSGTLRQQISTRRSNLSWKNGSENIGHNGKQEGNGLQHESVYQEAERMHAQKYLNSQCKSPSSIQTSARIHTSRQAETGEKSGSSCGRKGLYSPLMEGKIQGKRDSVVPLKSPTIQFNAKEGAHKPMNPTISPRASSEVEIQADAVENNDRGFPISRKLMDSSHVLPFEGIKSNDSTTKMLSDNMSHDHASQNSEQSSAVLEGPHGCRRNEKGDMWSVDNSAQFGAMLEYRDVNEITGSVDCSKFLKMRRKHQMQHGQNESIDTKRTCELAVKNQDSYGCVRATFTGLHNDLDVTGPMSSSCFAIGEAATSLERYSDFESEKVTGAEDPQPISVHYSERFQGPLLRIESGTQPSQCSLNDDHEAFNGNVVGADILELQVGGSDFNVDLESSFPEVDPILIPGPPGSDLPSFSDMGSEDLHRSSSLNSSVAQSSGGADDVDRDLSDSPLSATSTISNLGAKQNPTVVEPECLTDSYPGVYNVYPMLSSMSSERPMLGTSKLFSQLNVTDTKRVTSLVDNSKNCVLTRSIPPFILDSDMQQCSCSRKEGVPWSSISNIEESQPLGQRLQTMVTSSTGKHAGFVSNRPNRNAVVCFSNRPRGESKNLPNSSETSYENVMPMEITAEATVSYPRGGDYDSATPPILRLMGKDLMVINKSKVDGSMDQAVQNFCKNRHMLPVSEFPFEAPRSWEHQPTQSCRDFTGPQFYEQDHHTYGSLNARYNSQSCGVGDTYLSKVNVDVHGNNSSIVPKSSVKDSLAASDPMVIPSYDSHTHVAAGAIKGEMQIQQISAEPGKPLHTDKNAGNFEFVRSSRLNKDELLIMDGSLVPSSMIENEAFEHEHVNVAQPKILGQCPAAETTHPSSNILVVKSSSPQGVEETTSKITELKFSDGKNVVIPNHIQVPDAVKNKLSFGSLDATFGVRENYLSSESNMISNPATDSAHVEAASNPFSCDLDVVSIVPDGNLVDQPQSLPHSPGENLCSEPKILFSSTVPKNDQPREEASAAVAPPFDQSSPSCSFGFMPTTGVNVLIQTEGVESQNHVSSSLTGSSPAMPTNPSPAQSAGAGQGYAVSPRWISRFCQPYPPNNAPYNHLSPFLIPPTMHQHSGHMAFPLAHPPGSLYLPPPRAMPGMKICPAPYKPGTNDGNQVPVGVPSGYGPYTSSQVGFSFNASATSGNSNATAKLVPSACYEGK